MPPAPQHEPFSPPGPADPQGADRRFPAPLPAPEGAHGAARPGPSASVKTVHWLVALVLVGASAGLALSGVAPSVYPVLLALAAGLALGLAIRLTAGFGRFGSILIRRLHDRIEAQSDQIWRLEEIVAHYRSVAETLGDVVIRRDASGAVVFVNESYERMFAMPRAAVLGRPLSVPPVPFDRQPGTGQPLALETVEGRKWFARFDEVVRFDGLDRSLFQTVLRDVSREREAEMALIRTRDAAEAANEAKSRFLASVSHEIRTPLNGILGMTGLLLDTTLTGEQTTYARAVAASGKALLSLIDDVLDFSKIEAGRLDLHPAPVALEELIEDLVELLAPRAHARGIEIGAYVSPAVPQRIEIDGDRLRQVLLNLLGNAIKFTERGGVSLECGAGPVRGNRVDIRIAVRDTGIGIAEADRDRVFGEFEQAEHGPSRRYGGSGLGLAISRRIVRRMGGDIRLDSSRGAGAEFSFAVAAPVVEGGEPAAEPFAGCRFAVVSPAGIEAGQLRRRLEDAGAEVVVAASAGALSGRFDGILVDAGADLAAGAPVRIEAEGGDPVPAAVLVKPTERNELATLQARGFKGYLVKPVRRASLLQVAARLAGRGDAWIEQAGDGPDPAATAGPPSRCLSVLLVEDNEINALLARALLEKLGHRVLHVEDGRAAIRAVGAELDQGRHGFDCVLTDLHMPGMDGRETIREIRRMEEAAGVNRLPIIALTADMMSETRDDTLAIGADALLTKPVEGPRLAAVLGEIVPAPPSPHAAAAGGPAPPGRQD